MSKATALLFPGQGAQKSGMGRDVAEASKDVMELWKKAEKISALPLRSIYWESNDPALMADTKNLQPALTLVNITLWQQLAGHISPQAAAGHSLGEYSAYAAAGVLDTEKVLEFVSLRGKLMAETDPSGTNGMAALVKLSRENAETIAHEAAEQSGELLIVANYNTPAQFVLSGSKKALSVAASLAKAKKGRLMPLAVSTAFHSPIMKEAATELAKVLTKATWHKPHFPVYSNVTGKAVTDGESLCDLACRQITSQVRWIETIRSQWDDGIRCWMEIGPQAILSKMVKPNLDPECAEEMESLTMTSLENVQNYLQA